MSLDQLSVLNILGSLIQGIGILITRNQGVIFDRINDIFPELDDLLEDIGLDMREILGEILGDVEGSLGGLITGINGSTIKLLDGVGGVLEGVGSTIGDALESAVSGIRRALERMIESISEALRDAVNTIAKVVSDIAEEVIKRVSDLVDRAIELINSAIERMAEFFRNLFQRASELLAQIADTVTTKISDFVDAVRETMIESFNEITDFISRQIEAAAEFIREATTAIAEVGEAIVSSAEEILNVVATEVNEAIAALTDTASGALSAVREGLDNLQTAVTSALEGLGPVLSEFVVTPTSEATRRLVEGITGRIDQAVITPQEDMARILTCMGLPQEAADQARKIINCVFDDDVAFGPFLQNLLVIFANLLVGVTWTQQLAQAAGIKAMQEIQPAFPIALPDPSFVHEMMRMGVVDEKQATSLLVKNGFSEENTARILEIRRRLPEVGFVQVWFLRNFIDREDAAALLQQLGFTPADAERTLDMAFFIPPVSDLITMAVREVFTPEVAERFGQFEDFPPQFAQFASQQGISEEWARNYWAAHWALPSVQMGFEMLHRRVIDEDELNLLLRAQDVMPFWRDKLTAISYNPLTRVDVRRMHKLGVLSNDEVRDAYRDIGYNEQNAERLLQFTIELNKPDEGDTPEVLEGLTRAAIISLFRRGTITRSETAELLRTIGLGAAAAETFIQVAELQDEEQQREEETALVIDRAKAGIITRSQAEDQLNALGMSAVETERALLKLQRALDAEAQLPAKQDLDKMLQARIISEVVYLDTMTRLGFSSVWATRFLQLARTSEES